MWNGSAWVLLSTGTANPPAMEMIMGIGCSAGGTASNGVVTVGSTVSVVTVTDAFSSSYDNYRIVMYGSQSSSGTDLRFALGNSATGSAYYGSYYYDAYTGGGTGTARQSNATFAYIGGIASTNNEQSLSFDIFRPQLAQRTSLHGQAYGNGYSFWFSFTNASTTQFTSFSISNTGGTITGGTIRVYGYRN